MLPLQPLLHIISDKEIIFGHLAAYDVEPFVVGAADDAALQDIMLGQVEVVDFHGDNGTLVGGEIIVVGQESKAVGAYVVQFALDNGSTVRKRNGAGIGNIQTRVLAAIVNLGTGLNVNGKVVGKLLYRMYDFCSIPAVQHIAYGYLQFTFGNIGDVGSFGEGNR